MWLARLDRAKLLRQVPPENSVRLVELFGEKLHEIFPVDFTTNPLDAVADHLKERGIPFEDTPQAGDDSRLEWRRFEAAVGTDTPDTEFAAESSR
jgi:hypothetical protein